MNGIMLCKHALKQITCDICKMLRSIVWLMELMKNTNTLQRLSSSIIWKIPKLLILLA